MKQPLTRYLGIGLTFVVIAASIAVLNVSPAITAAAECEAGGGGGGGDGDGGGGGGASPSGSGTASPSESDDGGLPIPIPPIGEEEETATPSGTPSEPPGGSGETERCPTKLTIAARSRASSSTVTFKGEVRSPKGKCKPGRDIALHKDRREGKDPIVGSTVSNRKGKWTVREPAARGKYYAKASRRRVGSVTCLAGRSKSIKA